MSIPLRVLLIDDNSDDAAMCVLELKDNGYAPVHDLVCTEEALRIALASHTWDIILSDHSMPGFTAPDALRVVQELGVETPFIVVSGSIGEEVAVALIKAGATDFVAKDNIAALIPAVQRALLVSTDQRARTRAEEALRESEARFALAVRGSRDGIWDWNIALEQMYFSPRLKEMLGIEEDERSATMDSFFARVHEDDRAQAERALIEHLDERIPFDVEFRACTAPGEIRWFCARGQALWDSEGKATRVAGSLTDLTARKRTEAALLEQLELVKRQQEAIRTMSTPLIEVWDGVLTVPVLGVLDQTRAEQMMESLLAAVSRTRYRHVIIDLTGVTSMDASTADHLVKLVNAVQLLGARGLIVGLQPRVAQAIVAIGVDLSSIRTLATLRDGLVVCMNRRSN